MRRKIYDRLLRWKHESQGRSAILIDGARRVGKSYIAREFGKNEYDSFILIDFNNIHPDLRQIFEDYLTDLPNFFRYLSAFTGVRLVERRSLIIFDEVQQYPRARGAIKYLVEDGRYDYLETGSLISINKNVKDIVIPSEEERVKMYPMDFEEYLWAVGQEGIYDIVKENFARKRPLGVMHRRAMSLFREYMAVGGMPQAVAAFAAGADFQEVNHIKENILNLYKADIAKYADGQEYKVKAIFDQIPSQLNRHEKKFKLSDLTEGARMRDYDTAFFWLADSMIANIAYNATEPNIGLRLNLDKTTLKCFMGDTGLLLTLANGETHGGENDLYRKFVSNKLAVNHGMLVENVVAQMLRASGHDLFFFSSYSKTDSEERMEIDFLVRNREVTSRHNIRPIEVKSGPRYTFSSLDKFCRKYDQYISNPTVLHADDLREERGFLFLPLYMTPLL